MTFFFHAWGNGISFKQMDFFIGNGAVAMEGFFLLSGFVTYISTKNVTFANREELICFYRGKILRLLPLGVIKLILCKAIWADFSTGGYLGCPMKFCA